MKSFLWMSALISVFCLNFIALPTYSADLSEYIPNSYLALVEADFNNLDQTLSKFVSHFAGGDMVQEMLNGFTKRIEQNISFNFLKESEFIKVGIDTTKRMAIFATSVNPLHVVCAFPYADKNAAYQFIYGMFGKIDKQLSSAKAETESYKGRVITNYKLTDPWTGQVKTTLSAYAMDGYWFIGTSSNAINTMIDAYDAHTTLMYNESYRAMKHQLGKKSTINVYVSPTALLSVLAQYGSFLQFAKIDFTIFDMYSMIAYSISLENDAINFGTVTAMNEDFPEIDKYMSYMNVAAIENPLYQYFPTNPTFFFQMDSNMGAYLKMMMSGTFPGTGPISEMIYDLNEKLGFSLEKYLYNLGSRVFIAGYDLQSLFNAADTVMKIRQEAMDIEEDYLMEEDAFEWDENPSGKPEMTDLLKGVKAEDVDILGYVEVVDEKVAEDSLNQINKLVMNNYNEKMSDGMALKFYKEKIKNIDFHVYDAHIMKVYLGIYKNNILFSYSKKSLESFLTQHNSMKKTNFVDSINHEFVKNALKTKVNNTLGYLNFQKLLNNLSTSSIDQTVVDKTFRAVKNISHIYLWGERFYNLLGSNFKIEMKPTENF